MKKLFQILTVAIALAALVQTFALASGKFDTNKGEKDGTEKGVEGSPGI